MASVSMLWIGDRLSPIECLSMMSYLYYGHSVDLYVYANITGVPLGVRLRDGGEILSKERIFSYQRGVGQGSFSAFSNMFRYKLMLTRWTYWSDTDVLCLKPLDFEDGAVFGWEDDLRIGSAILRFPTDSAPLAQMLATALRKGQDVAWGDVGPKLVTDTLREFAQTDQAKPVSTFYPLHYGSWRKPFQPEFKEEVTAACSESHALHLWHEMFRRNDFEKFTTPDPESFVGNMWAKYSKYFT